MFTPNTTGSYSAKAPADRNGEYGFGPARTVRCGIVELTGLLKKTPPRAGTSASKGANDEDVASARILFRAADLKPEIGDRFVVQGIDLRFTGVEPRFDVFGRLDHYECVFEAYPGAPS